MDRKLMRRLCLALCLLLAIGSCASAEILNIPDDVKVVESQAFADCPQIDIVYVPALCTVAEDAFAENTIVVRRGSFQLNATLRRLSDAQISALTAAAPAEMRAAVSTLADAKALLLQLFPEVDARTTAAAVTGDDALQLTFPAPEELLRSAPSSPQISEVDIDNLLAYLLADDAPTGVIVAFAASETARAVFGWLDGQLLYPQSVAWVQTVDGFTLISLHGS